MGLHSLVAAVISLHTGTKNVISLMPANRLKLYNGDKCFDLTSHPPGVIDVTTYHHVTDVKFSTS